MQYIRLFHLRVVLLSYGEVEIIYEPIGGAHRDPDLAINRIAAALSPELASLIAFTAQQLRADRREKFLRMGYVKEGGSAAL